MTKKVDNPQYISSRLRLRPPRLDDASAICGLANNPLVSRRMTRLPYPYTTNDAMFFLEKVASKEETWIIELRDTSITIGVIGLAPSSSHGEVSLGYWLGSSFWGNGYAAEAVRSIVAHAFNVRGYSKLTAGCFADNLASINVLQKTGFCVQQETKQWCPFEKEELQYKHFWLLAECHRFSQSAQERSNGQT
jgi:RimJ/RimL family protein N-acetyltransferase